jgi:hypothetical protein
VLVVVRPVALPLLFMVKVPLEAARAVMRTVTAPAQHQVEVPVEERQAAHMPPIMVQAHQDKVRMAVPEIPAAMPQVEEEGRKLMGPVVAQVSPLI